MCDYSRPSVVDRDCGSEVEGEMIRQIVDDRPLESTNLATGAPTVVDPAT